MAAIFPGTSSATTAEGRTQEPHYLEGFGNTVHETIGGTRSTFVVRSRGCKSRFCRHCCPSLGYGTREKLTSALETFSAIIMITLTVDPWLFREGD